MLPYRVFAIYNAQNVYTCSLFLLPLLGSPSYCLLVSSSCCLHACHSYFMFASSFRYLLVSPSCYLCAPPALCIPTISNGCLTLLPSTCLSSPLLLKCIPFYYAFVSISFFLLSAWIPILLPTCLLPFASFFPLGFVVFMPPSLPLAAYLISQSFCLPVVCILLLPPSLAVSLASVPSCHHIPACC